MTDRLKDKVALVTAAGQGIGKATAIAFHKEGAKVIATDINDKTLNELNKEYPKIEIKNLDSTNKDAIKNYVNTKNMFQLSGILSVISSLIPLIPSGSFFSTYPSSIFWINYALMMSYINFKK